MNAVDLLESDHRLVEDLFKKVEDTPPSRHPALFKKIKGELDTHAHIEEVIFYPALQEKGDKALVDIVLEGFEEHSQIKKFLNEIDAITVKNESYEAKLKVLIEDTRHHVKEEEDEMFPMVEDQFSSTALDKLGERMEAEKVKFQKSEGIMPTKISQPKGTLEVIMEKARAVVGEVFAGPATGSTRQAGSQSGAPKKTPARKAAAPAPATRKAGNGKGQSTDTKAKAAGKAKAAAAKSGGTGKSASK